MPKIKGDTLPSQAIKDWGKDVSVFDPWYKKAAKTAVRGVSDFIPDETDPTSYMNPMAGVAEKAVAAPLISIFKNKAEREVGTEAFKESAKQFPKYVRKGITSFAEKYPRIAAHMEPGNYFNAGPKGERGLAALAVPDDVVKDTMPMNVTKELEGWARGSSHGETPENAAKHVIHHEGGHAAQALGNRNTSDMYKLSEDLWGYKGNPFEMKAEVSGDRARGLKSSGPPVHDIIRNKIADERVAANKTGKAIDPKRLSKLNLMEDVLNMRKDYGWKPDPNYGIKELVEK